MDNHNQQRKIITTWKADLANSINELDELLSYLNLKKSDLDPLISNYSRFPLRVPRNYAERMEKGNPFDPLLLQVLPFERENHLLEGYTLDPVKDLESVVDQGILRKYNGRALLITTGACAIHCRYCFRRNFPYTESLASSAQWKTSVEYLSIHHDISEVILSGGDPLVLSDRRLSALCKQIETLEHIKQIRVHSRFPVVVPNRINRTLLDWVSAFTKPFVFVIHCNHANELSIEVTEALKKLRQANVILLNQSVLLKGVNDNIIALTDLSEKLIEAGVIPYYLHMLDPVSGTAHFNVSQQSATRLIEKLTANLSGYMIPKLVREIPGATNKVASILLPSDSSKEPN